MPSTGALVEFIKPSSYGFDDPDGLSSDGTDVWATNTDQSLTGFPA